MSGVCVRPGQAAVAGAVGLPGFGRQHRLGLLSGFGFQGCGFRP